MISVALPQQSPFKQILNTELATISTRRPNQAELEEIYLRLPIVAIMGIIYISKLIVWSTLTNTTPISIAILVLLYGLTIILAMISIQKGQKQPIIILGPAKINPLILPGRLVFLIDIVYCTIILSKIPFMIP